MTQLSSDKQKSFSKPKKPRIGRIFSILFHRLVIVSLLIILQIAVLAVGIIRLRRYFPYIYLLFLFISFAAVVYILCNRSVSAYKIAWIVPIMSFPLFGGLFYLIAGGYRQGRSNQKFLHARDKAAREEMKTQPNSRELLKSSYPECVRTSDFIRNCSGYPCYPGEVKYYGLGDDAFFDMLRDLRSAEHFIFLEYFILEKGEMWNTILDILKAKAAEGVEVRVLYDDVGSMFTLTSNYKKELESFGIHAAAFTPFIPVLSTRLNNRDHRKITVIDGRIAYTGGYNLADEYINAKERFGHWKDSGVRLTGDAVYSFTVMFLSVWNNVNFTQQDLVFSDYSCPEPESKDALVPNAKSSEGEKGGFIQPYGVQPMDNDHMAEGVILQIIADAEKYVYLTTPYLIIDDSVTSALCQAAKSGVNVCLVTPGIPDKRYAFELTRAHYLPLLEAGVKIYEYTPGFIHSKNIVSDDCYAVVGTINLDYRSLYLHYEDAVWMCHCRAISDIREDVEQCISVSREIRIDTFRPGPLKRLARAFLRFLAPLM